MLLYFPEDPPTYVILKYCLTNGERKNESVLLNMSSSHEIGNEIWTSAYAMLYQETNEPFLNVSERQPSLLQDQRMEGLKNTLHRLFVTLE